MNNKFKIIQRNSIMLLVAGIPLLLLLCLAPSNVSAHDVTQGPEDFPPDSGHPEVFVDSNGIQRCDPRATEQNDRLAGTCIQGREGNDLLFAIWIPGIGSTHIFGDNGNDKIIGSEERDRLHGTNGNDDIVGNEGDDIIFGDEGNDRMKGGPGADLFHCGPGNDLITDFNPDEGDQKVIVGPDCRLPPSNAP